MSKKIIWSIVCFVCGLGMVMTFALVAMFVKPLMLLALIPVIFVFVYSLAKVSEYERKENYKWFVEHESEISRVINLDELNLEGKKLDTLRHAYHMLRWHYTDCDPDYDYEW